MTVRWVGTFVAARICHVWPATIRRWCRDGKIPPESCELTAGGHLRVDSEFLRGMKEKRSNESNVHIQSGEAEIALPRGEEQT